jgi:2-polyprenyl-3-methyl-5-hydroxy-6-metoxy-1,4-benzoquinol methylase
MSGSERCPVCLASEPLPEDDKTWLLGFEGWGRLVRCVDCTLVYLRDYSPALLESHGDDFVRTKVSQSGHEPSREHDELFTARLAWAEARTSGRRALDIGCGNGAFLLAAKQRGWTAFGLDNSVVPGELLAPHGIEVSVADAVEYLGQRRAGFDLIHMNHSLEHIPQAAETLLAARHALAPGGLLYVEVPNELDNLVYRALALLGRKRKRGSFLGRSRPASTPSPHLYFFNKRSLRRLAQRAGLSSIDVHARRREAFDFSATEAACAVAALLDNGIFLTLTASAPSER